MNVIKDDVIGILNYNEGNKFRDIKITFFGKENVVSLNIRGDEDTPIQPYQYKAYKELYKNSLISDVEDKIFSYYLSEVDEYRNMYEEEADQFAPLIKDKSELSALVSLFAIIIPENDKLSEIDMLFTCTWDIDSGVGVRIIDGVVQEVGTQHVAICG